MSALAVLCPTNCHYQTQKNAMGSCDDVMGGCDDHRRMIKESGSANCSVTCSFVSNRFHEEDTYIKAL